MCKSILTKPRIRAAILLTTLFFLLLWVGPSTAQNLQKGRAAHEQKDWETALKELRPLAEQGNAEAQTLLGRMYYYAQGVPRDRSKGFEFFQEATQGGYAGAKYWLAKPYFARNSKLVQRDVSKGITLYEEAAQGGYAQAQYALALLLNFGEPSYGLPMDKARATELMHSAAEQGHIRAQHSLGSSYLLPPGNPKNSFEAVRWFRRAAEQGHSASMLSLGYLYSDGVGLKADYAEAVTWYRRAAEQGDFRAYSRIAEAYATGRGVLQDFVQAHKWYNLAAQETPYTNQSLQKSLQELSEKMSPSQIEEAQRLAREWEPKKES